MNITLINKNRGRLSRSKMSLDDLVQVIRHENILPLVKGLREEYPILLTHPQFLNEKLQRYEEEIPEVCFAASYRMYRHAPRIARYNALLSLSITNLPCADDAARLRHDAARIPYTRLAFVGADGYSVVVVCSLACEDGKEPATEAEMLKLQQTAFRLLHYHYSSQLGICFDIPEVSLYQSHLVSCDSQLYYNPASEPYFVRSEVAHFPEYHPLPTPSAQQLLPNYSETETMDTVFEWCLGEACQQARETENTHDEMCNKALSLLADYCHESRLPIEFALRHVGWKSMFRMPEDYIRKVFENAYEHKVEFRPLAHVERSALLTMQTEAFLNAHYELRRNIMTGVVQFRLKDGYGSAWRELDELALNAMTVRALKLGLGSWDKDIRRLVYSSAVPEFQPLAEWLYQLPRWDGRDRVEELVRRIPTNTPDAAYYLHLWMRSMVAQWLGRERGRGNAIVPLLIGGQGCGKTTFCTLLLPPALRDYYIDRVDFKNDSALSLGLSSFALINIDEFDSLKKSQQPTLKYLVSKGDVKLRPPYGKTFVSRRRFASFIATTNSRHPLTDPSGSRRFVCIQVCKGQSIDCDTSIDYCQLYAQLYAEVTSGMRYWLTDEENERLMQQNRPYQLNCNLYSVIDELFGIPTENGPLHYSSVSKIANDITQAYPEIAATRNLRVEVGKLMKEKGFPRRKMSAGIEYAIVPRSI